MPSHVAERMNRFLSVMPFILVDSKSFDKRASGIIKNELVQKCFSHTAGFNFNMVFWIVVLCICFNKVQIQNDKLDEIVKSPI
jgi:hypothetical protein